MKGSKLSRHLRRSNGYLGSSILKKSRTEGRSYYYPKISEEWNKARELLSKPELSLKQNDDKQVAMSLEKAKKEYPSPSLFFIAMKHSIQYMVIVHNSSGWKVQITYIDSKVRTITSTFLK